MTEVSPRRSSWIGTVMAICLLIALSVLGLWLIYSLWQSYLALPVQLAAPLTVASTTVLVSVFSLIFSKHWERKWEIEQEHRKQKLPIYEEFLVFWFKVLVKKAGETPVSETEMIEFFRTFTQKLMIWGSDDVVKEYAKFRAQSVPTSENQQLVGMQLLFAFESLLYAIRSDVGHANKNLLKGDLLSLFVNDIRTYVNR